MATMMLMMHASGFGPFANRGSYGGLGSFRKVEIPLAYKPEVSTPITIEAMGLAIDAYQYIDQAHRQYFFACHYKSKIMIEYMSLYDGFRRDNNDQLRELSNDELFELLKFAFTHDRISNPNLITREPECYKQIGKLMRRVKYIDSYYLLYHAGLFTRENFDRINKLSIDPFNNLSDWSELDQSCLGLSLRMIEARVELEKLRMKYGNKLSNRADSTDSTKTKKVHRRMG